MLAVTILVIFVILGVQSQKPCDIHNTVDIKFEDMRMLYNGSLHDLKDDTIYPRGTYWRERNIYRGCICKVKPCIRKCCFRNEYRDFSGNCTSANLTLSEIEELFKPMVFDAKTLEPNVELNNIKNRFGILDKQICTQDRYRLEPSVLIEDQFFLLPNGSLHVPALKMLYDENSFCMDYFMDMGAVLPLLCFEPEAIATKVMYTSYPVGMIISIIFMVLTLIVYILLPELRNLHGKLLMCHVASLLIAYIALAFVQLGSNDMSTWLCISAAFVIEFTFAAAFFWLNIMCFDICWMFNGKTTSMRGSAADRERRKLLIYSVYAWGCPLVLLIISAAMQFSPLPDEIITPQFGESKCWFHDEISILAYFYAPISLLLICNAVLFAVTAFRIMKLRRGTAVLKHADSQRSDQREKQQKFVLYMKLFLVMGMTWIMEIVSGLIGGSAWLWIITDICNSLQGLCIFLIFVWKPKVRRLLRARFSKERPLSFQESNLRNISEAAAKRRAENKYLSSCEPHSIVTSTTDTRSNSFPSTQASSLIPH